MTRGRVLSLVDLPLPVLVALRDGELESAAAQLGLDIPEDFAANVDIWTFMVGLRTNPVNDGWTISAMVSGGVIVGNAGFKGAPDEQGEIEIGYFVLEPHRGQGLAVAAARLLCDRATREPSVSRVIATIAPDNAASIAVISAAGFAPAGDRIHEQWGRQLVYARYVSQPAVRH